MKYISCNFNLFTQYHTIYLHDGEETKTISIGDTDHLAQIIVAACAQEEVESVHLFGIKSFLEPIAEDICILNKTHYSNLNIIVEVN